MERRGAATRGQITGVLVARLKRAWSRDSLEAFSYSKLGLQGGIRDICVVVAFIIAVHQVLQDNSSM